MKTTLLKKIREYSWSKYEVRNWSHIPSCRERPWRIGNGPKSTLSGYEYATREEAIEAIKLLWHEEAEKFLWNKRNKRKKNKYLW